MMHLGHQRAGGVEYPQAAALGFVTHRARHPMGAEDHDGAVRHLVQFIHEHRAHVAQAFHHIAVVHHLVAHIDGRAVDLEGALHDLDGAVDAGTETARIGKQDIACSYFTLRAVRSAALRGSA